MKSQLTTLCYIEKNDAYLMLHRTTKHNDENHNKWIGVGGHFERGESPEDCLVREVREETGLTLQTYQFRGIVTFISDSLEEYMCLYTATEYSGDTSTAIYPQTSLTQEGELSWVKKQDVLKLNLWEGDKIFLNLLTKDEPFFSIKLVYKDGLLIESILNGKLFK